MHRGPSRSLPGKRPEYHRVPPTSARRPTAAAMHFSFPANIPRRLAATSPRPPVATKSRLWDEQVTWFVTWLSRPFRRKAERSAGKASVCYFFLLVKTDCGFDPRGARRIFCRAVQTYETIVPTIDWEFSTWTFKSQKNSWILRYFKNAVKFNTTLLRCRKNNFFASADFKILHSRPYKAALTTVAVTSRRA